MDEADIAATLIGLEGERRDALIADDMTKFAALIADDVVHVHTTGIVQDKSQLLRHAGEFLRFIEIERRHLNVRVLSPEIAVMTGEMTNLVRRRDQDEEVKVDAFVTQVWAKRQGRWRIVSLQATRV